MKRRGFLGSLVATAAGVLVPADVLASPGRVYFDMGRRPWLERGVLVGGLIRLITPGVYMLAAKSESGWLVNLDALVTPRMIERGETIAIQMHAPYAPPIDETVHLQVARVGDLSLEEDPRARSRYYTAKGKLIQ